MILNDDCLLLIFELLGLKDQISVALAHRRFRYILFYLWQKKHVNLSLNFGIEDITDKEFSILMKGISNTVQQIRLRDLTFERLAELNLYEYPNLTKFSFTQWSRFLLEDDSILEMAKIFPTLRSFSPHGPFSGKYMENWRYLQHLNLTYCAKVKFSHMERIFEELLLKSVQLNVFDRYYEWTSERAFKNFCNLETIFLNTIELAWLSKLALFTNLKELSIADRYTKGAIHGFLRNINDYKYNDLIEIETNLNFPLHGGLTREFVHFKRLAVLSQQISDYTSLHYYIFNLREIIFKCCEISTSSNLSRLLTRPSQIEFISIEQCRCEFQEFRINCKDITQQRTKLLHFNFYENTFIHNNSPTFMRQCIPVSLIVDGNSPLLKITADISTPVNFDPLCVHFR